MVTILWILAAQVFFTACESTNGTATGPTIVPSGVNGEWSDWRRTHFTSCQTGCVRTVKLTRTCTNPAPSGGGRQCNGSITAEILETCMGDNCLKVDGEWSNWRRTHFTLCQMDCVRAVQLTRTCTNPAPSGGGRQCNGSISEEILETCMGDNCDRVDGKWSDWKDENIGPCQTSCWQMVRLTRTCTNPAPSGGGRQCVGRNTSKTVKRCRGDNCTAVDGKWSDWKVKNIGPCGTSCWKVVRLTRTCTNPAPSEGGRRCVGTNTSKTVKRCRADNCIEVDGQWSDWETENVGPCQESCWQTEWLTRTCTNPAPSGGGLPCVGHNTTKTEMRCRGDNCTAVLQEKGLLSQQSKSGNWLWILVMVGVVVGVTVNVFTLYRLKKRRNIKANRLRDMIAHAGLSKEASFK
ncbi:coadhesin-like isoform X2 [Gigantopelta aegis]|uniref:coadhesin-like isoform X2 n=1 Tax=Gigantopelta aegis TaxID=1735272 RepID=UPI001B88AF08|nr:coadhesin-like isoform X2 [Gigantopelta aegis]